MIKRKLSIVIVFLECHDCPCILFNGFILGQAMNVHASSRGLESLDVSEFVVRRGGQEVELINMETKGVMGPWGTGCNWGHGQGARV